MNSPRTILLVGLLALLLIGGNMLFLSDGASMTVKIMQYLFLGLALIAVIGALIQMRRK